MAKKENTQTDFFEEMIKNTNPPRREGVNVRILPGDELPKRKRRRKSKATVQAIWKYRLSREALEKK